MINKFINFVSFWHNKFYSSATFRVADDKVVVWRRYSKTTFEAKYFLKGWEEYLQEKNVSEQRKLKIINLLKKYKNAIDNQIKYFR
jgi:hypothetical protein